MAGFLAEKGAAVLRNGFEVIPILPGQKFPGFTNWQTIPINEAVLRGWLRNGHADAGVGIRTKHTPLVDLDIFDEAACKEMQDLIHREIGDAPVRVGNAPKRGLLFRTETPFTKIASRTYIDDEGRDTRVEILGDGQQFVAYHFHPETHKPYRWLSNDSPALSAAEWLPTITAEQARWIVERFEEIAERRGWAVKRGLQAVSTRIRAPVPADDEFDLGTDPVGLSEEELTAKVMAIPNDQRFEAREDWISIGFAIAHETGKSEFGRDLWLEWSEQHPSHDYALFEKAWRSFGKRDDTTRPITARYILKLAKEYEKAAIVESVNEIIERMTAANSIDELRKAALDSKRVDADLMDRARLINALRKNAETFRVKLSLADAREMVRYDPATAEMPDWLKGWIYLQHADRFFNTITGQSLPERAFNSTFKRYSNDVLPADIALKLVKIRTVYMNGYLPGSDDYFWLNGFEYANTFSRRNMPEIPAVLQGTDRENVIRVRDHFSNLFPDEREHQLAISFFAHVVQTESRPNWAIMMQGVEGDGRSFFGHMMAAVLGGDNCRTISAQRLEDRFTAWATGQLFTLIEEVRMIGHNRHDVLNSIKPYITNDTIDIRAMNTDSYNAPNTTAYMLTTNFQNALPLSDTDRRYFVLMSQWQDADAIELQGQQYFRDLWKTLDSAGAIRGWLLKYKLHPEFDAKGRAPRSRAKALMIELNKADDIVTTEDLIDGGRYVEISNEIVVVSKLQEILSERNSNFLIKQTAVAAILRQLGFQHVGRLRLGGDRKEQIWSKIPARFMRKGLPATDLIRLHIENQL